MGRPTGVSDAPVAPAAGGSWDLRSRALVSEPVVPDGAVVAEAVAGDDVGTGRAAAAQSVDVPGAGERPAGEETSGGQPTGEPAAAPRAPEVVSAAPVRRLGASRRGPADPVKTLMHRHRALCERAVDPLEIAAGLEAHGVTDRAAARYRHRDVFSLAEELFARVPAVTGEPATGLRTPERDTETRAVWTLRALVPGAACLATAGALRLTEGALGGQGRLVITLIGAVVALIGLVLSLRSGPLHAGKGSSGTAHVYSCWLLGYVLYGDALLGQVLSGGPEGPWTITPAPLLGLALSVAPAAWCAHLFSVRAHRRLNGSRALQEFAAGVRPLLFGAVVLHLGALAGLLYLAHLGYGGGGSFVGAAALGVLLLLARLLSRHGLPGHAAAGLAAACAAEALAPALVLAGRLPGLHFLARPVDVLVAAAGTGAVPAVACGAAALGLLITATVALSRASAHTPAHAGDETRTTA
ncbi:hypothetical protein ACF1BU_16155 [Streptomyces sp. NPDC014724]|uniref:hypothetical protein n=1 Tax=unclassified Streptomyces TaxID=2593676 RepID=UPI0036FEF8E7